MKKTIAFVLGATMVLALFASFAARTYADDNQGGEGQTSLEAEGNHGEVVSSVARGENEGEGQQSMQESVAMGANGSFEVSGVKVNSVDASSMSLNVSFYGFTRSVSLAGASIKANRQQIRIGDIQAGDILSGKGNWNEAAHVLTVTEVNDLSYAARNVSNIQDQISKLLELVRQLQAQLEALRKGQ